MDGVRTSSVIGPELLGRPRWRWSTNDENALELRFKARPVLRVGLGPHRVDHGAEDTPGGRGQDDLEDLHVGQAAPG
jgi:hypothetical protein